MRSTDSPQDFLSKAGDDGNVDDAEEKPMTGPLPPAPMSRRRVTYPIDGLDCGAALPLERALARVGGVTRAYVNPATEMIYVEYDARRCGDEDIAAAVRSAGYTIGTLDRF